MIRKLDELGRIVIPVEIRNEFNLQEGDKLEIEERNNEIILRKHKDVFCPQCLKKCEHTDNFCSNCGLEFNTLTNKLHNVLTKDENAVGIVISK